MIVAKEGIVMFEGSRGDILAETTMVLRTAYKRLVEDDGIEKANEQLAEIGRLAIMSEDEIADEAEKIIKEVLEKLGRRS